MAEKYKKCKPCEAKRKAQQQVQKYTPRPTTQQPVEIPVVLPRPK